MADVDPEESTRKEERESPESPEKRRKVLRRSRRRLLSKASPLRPNKLPPRGRAEEEEAERVKNDLFNLNHSSHLIINLRISYYTDCICKLYLNITSQM